MTQLYSGGCACGAVRYEANADPIVGVDCQCRDCSHESGTGHASHLVFASAAMKITGRAGHWSMIADSGNKKTRGFCPECGTPVYMTFAANPGIVSVRAGSLDDPGLYSPQLITYRSRAFAWDRVNPDLPSFDKMPPQ